MINKEFFAALELLETEKKIPKEVFLSAMKDALILAYKKQYGAAKDIEITLLPEKNAIKITAFLTVVEEVEDKDTQISLEDAKLIDRKYKVGDRIEARVTDVKPDGKLDLSLREKAFIQMDRDAEAVMEKLLANGGELPFTDKADPELIRAEFGFGKNAFKRAVGRLLKEGKIEIREKTIAIR